MASLEIRSTAPGFEDPRPEATSDNRRNAGAKGLACNLWIRRMIEKGWQPGEPKEDNPMFTTWLALYEMENGREPGDAARSYRSAARRQVAGTN